MDYLKPSFYPNLRRAISVQPNGCPIFKCCCFLGAVLLISAIVVGLLAHYEVIYVTGVVLAIIECCIVLTLAVLLFVMWRLLAEAREMAHLVMRGEGRWSPSYTGRLNGNLNFRMSNPQPHIHSSTTLSTTHPNMNRPSTTCPSTTRPSSTHPSMHRPSTTHPSMHRPSTTHPSMHHLSTTNPSTTCSSMHHFSTTHPRTNCPRTHHRPSITRPDKEVRYTPDPTSRTFDAQQQPQTHPSRTRENNLEDIFVNPRLPARLRNPSAQITGVTELSNQRSHLQDSAIDAQKKSKACKKLVTNLTSHKTAILFIWKGKPYVTWYFKVLKKRPDKSSIPSNSANKSASDTRTESLTRSDMNRKKSLSEIYKNATNYAWKENFLIEWRYVECKEYPDQDCHYQNSVNDSSFAQQESQSLIEITREFSQSQALKTATHYIWKENSITKWQCVNKLQL